MLAVALMTCLVAVEIHQTRITTKSMTLGSALNSLQSRNSQRMMISGSLHLFKPNQLSQNLQNLMILDLAPQFNLIASLQEEKITSTSVVQAGNQTSACR